MMATGRAGTGNVALGDRRWGVGGLAGLLGAAVYGAVRILSGELVVSALTPSGVVGTLIWPGVVAGIGYALLAGLEPLEPLAGDPALAVLLGVGFGCLVWLATPIVGATGFGNLTACGMFGIVVGLVYAIVVEE